MNDEAKRAVGPTPEYIEPLTIEQRVEARESFRLASNDADRVLQALESSARTLIPKIMQIYYCGLGN